MDRDLTLENLETGVRAALLSGEGDVEAAVERYLEGELCGLSSGERAALVERLALRFTVPHRGCASPPILDPEAVAGLLSLLLGKDIPSSMTDAGDAPEKFAHALNTVFDTLNRLIGVINTTFFGRRPELETIRQVIGSHMGDGEGEASLTSYLEQIQQAFLIAHASFQESSREVVEEILAELAPDSCESSVSSGLKIGPLRKAEAFETYRRKYQACRRWIDSGGFTEKLLREFEKNCRKAGILKEG
ncbi:MAG: hypothetical protein GYA56_00675 [Geobacteraceae bacterium]|nr:hypothetical protein [Geobacteraceae bacterium]